VAVENTFLLEVNDYVVATRHLASSTEYLTLNFSSLARRDLAKPKRPRAALKVSLEIPDSEASSRKE